MLRAPLQRSQVQPKLQHFMFPNIPERPVILTELFASVFGRSVHAAASGGDAARDDEATAPNDADAPRLFSDQAHN